MLIFMPRMMIQVTVVLNVSTDYRSTLDDTPTTRLVSISYGVEIDQKGEMECIFLQSVRYNVMNHQVLE